MKKKKVIKIVSIILTIIVIIGVFAGCADIDAATTTKSTSEKLSTDTKAAMSAGADIIANQPAPTDLDYSLERYNLIRRAYWVNGQREKANTLQCEIEKPLGYIILFGENGAIINKFVVDGKVSSLGSYLFPAYRDTDYRGRTPSSDWSAWADSSVYSDGSVFTEEIPGIDGAYGSNVSGIFFFTIDGKYIEWTGDYLYSDIPFEVDDTVIAYKEAN